MKLNPRLLNKVVEVTWVDSASTHEGWMRAPTYGPSKITTYGLVTKVEKDREYGEYLSLVQSKSDSNNVLGNISIPMGCIVKIKKLLV